jgi:hypothetical protein
VNVAIDKFRRCGSTASDRRDAIRDLADILEFLRPQTKAVLTQQDESDLFNIANNFGIRHHPQIKRRTKEIASQSRPRKFGVGFLSRRPFGADSGSDFGKALHNVTQRTENRCHALP